MAKDGFDSMSDDEVAATLGGGEPPVESNAGASAEQGADRVLEPESAGAVNTAATDDQVSDEEQHPGDASVETSLSPAGIPPPGPEGEAGPGDRPNAEEDISAGCPENQKLWLGNNTRKSQDIANERKELDAALEAFQADVATFKVAKAALAAAHTVRSQEAGRDDPFSMYEDDETPSPPTGNGPASAPNLPPELRETMEFVKQLRNREAAQETARREEAQLTRYRSEFSAIADAHGIKDPSGILGSGEFLDAYHDKLYSAGDNLNAVEAAGKLATLLKVGAKAPNSPSREGGGTPPPKPPPKIFRGGGSEVAPGGGPLSKLGSEEEQAAIKNMLNELATDTY